MQNKKENKAKTLSVSKLIILCLFTTIIVTFLSLSKYSSTVTSNSNTKVAAPVINLSSDNTLDLNISPLEDEKIYIFKVSNNTIEKKSEVSMEYNLQIKTLNNLPLDFELYTYDGNVKGDKNLLSGNGTITENISMGFDENITHQYMLIIKWNKSDTSYQYNNVAELIEILLHSEQVD